MIESVPRFAKDEFSEAILRAFIDSEIFIKALYGDTGHSVIPS
jgi:hypothetical protein